MSQGAERGKGERIAAARKIRRLTQPQLAEAAAISVSLLRKIEQGRRPCSVAVWSSISRALGLKDGSADEMRSASYAVSAAIPEIRCAIDCYDIPDPGPVALIPDLHAATELATARRLDAQYSSLADSLPALLTELTRAVHNYTGHDQEIAFGLLALAYRAADALLRQVRLPRSFSPRHRPDSLGRRTVGRLVAGGYGCLCARGDVLRQSSSRGRPSGTRCSQRFARHRRVARGARHLWFSAYALGCPGCQCWFGRGRFLTLGRSP
jgi:DNA-binding XRE family transcriptional regulator